MTDQHQRSGRGTLKPSGIDLIAAERKRQIESEGWTAKHDDEHDGGEMAYAAACYAMGEIPRVHRLWEDTRGCRSAGETGPRSWKWLPAWPWAEKWWKPKDRLTDLVRAGALIAAEIDRLQRTNP